MGRQGSGMVMSNVSCPCFALCRPATDPALGSPRIIVELAGVLEPEALLGGGDVLIRHEGE